MISRWARLADEGEAGVVEDAGDACGFLLAKGRASRIHGQI